MIWLIVTMAAAATVTSASLYLTSGSTFGELFANNQARAYYLAEAGINYAKPLILQDLASGTTANTTALHNQTFTLAEGKFTLVIDNAQMPAYALIKSTGLVNENTWMEGKRTVTFRVNKPFAETFDPNTFAQNWSIGSGGAGVASVGPSGGQPALRIQAPGGSAALTAAVVGLNWDGALGAGNPGLPDLYAHWLASNRLLGYEIQVKVAPEFEGVKGNHFLMGLSFRLNTQGDLNAANDTSYGVSFFRSISTSNTAATWLATLDAAFNPIRNGNVYIVFWRKTTPGGMITLLDHAPVFPRWENKRSFAQNTVILPSIAKSNGRSYICITPAGCVTASSKVQEPDWPLASGATVAEKGGGSGTWRENGAAADQGLLTPGGTLADWSALGVKLEERYCTSPGDTVCSAASGTRANFVTVYTAQADVYPRNTISWDYATYLKPVTWTWRLPGQLLSSLPGPQTVLDGSLTSNLTYGADPIVKPLEIGIHGYAASSANNDMFYDDFALRLPASTGGGGGTSGGTQW